VRRRFVALVIWLIAGGSLNLLLATLCALWVPLHDWTRTDHLGLPPQYVPWLPPARLAEGVPTLYTEHSATGIGIEIGGLAIHRLEPLSLNPGYMLLVHRTGWPAASFMGESYTTAGNGIPIASTWSGVIPVSSTYGAKTSVPGIFTYERPMPIRPIWVGLIINTLLFAVLAWMTRSASRILRGHIRVLRHRCPSCGYPVGVSEVCTECGGEVGAAPPSA